MAKPKRFTGTIVEKRVSLEFNKKMIYLIISSFSLFFFSTTEDESALLDKLREFEKSQTYKGKQKEAVSKLWVWILLKNK